MIRVGLCADLVVLAILGVCPIFGHPQDDVVGLKHRVDQLEARMAALEDPLRPLNVTVNCAMGQTVGAALAQGQGKVGLLYITVVGVCEEEILIARDNVVIEGRMLTDGLKAPIVPRSTAVISINAARRVTLRRLTVSGGDLGITGLGGASFLAENIAVEGARIVGLGGDKGVEGLVRGATIRNNLFGVNVGSGGRYTLLGSQVSGNGIGVWAVGGGTVKVEQTTIENNSEFGAGAAGGGALDIGNTIVRNNPRIGLLLRSKAVATVRSGSQIANNGFKGVEVGFGSVLDLDATVESSRGIGVQAFGGSSVNLGPNAWVRFNESHGVWLQDTSTIGGFGNVVNNAGWGIYCSVPPAAAQISPFGSLVILGNSGGQTNCPLSSH